MRAELFDPLETIIDDMFINVSRELDWKVSIEAAQTYDRLFCVPGREFKYRQQTLKYLQTAVKSSPDNLKWKIWLIASRI